MDISNSLKEKIPLHHAAWAGKVKLLENLLSDGRDINEVDSIGLTALHCAVIGQHAKVVKLLLERGADADGNASSKRSPLHHAAQQGATEIIGHLLRHHAHVNSFDHLGRTPLYYAMVYRQGAAEMLLRKHGAKEMTRPFLFGED